MGFVNEYVGTVKQESKIHKGERPVDANRVHLMKTYKNCHIEHYGNKSVRTTSYINLTKCRNEEINSEWKYEVYQWKALKNGRLWNKKAREKS